MSLTVDTGDTFMMGVMQLVWLHGLLHIAITIRDPHENKMAHLTKLSFQIKYVRITCMVNTQIMITEKIGAVPGTDTP